MTIINTRELAMTWENTAKNLASSFNYIENEAVKQGAKTTIFCKAKHDANVKHDGKKILQKPRESLEKHDLYHEANPEANAMQTQKICDSTAEANPRKFSLRGAIGSLEIEALLYNFEERTAIKIIDGNAKEVDAIRESFIEFLNEILTKNNF